jgi:hypothetical protein
MNQGARVGDVMLAAETDLRDENFPPVDQEGPGAWRSLSPEFVKALWPAPPKPSGT